MKNKYKYHRQEGKELYANHDSLYDGGFIQKTLNVVQLRKLAS